MSLALIPGSFDPMTLGHVNLVERTARLFDRVVVAIMVNGAKHETAGGAFTFSQREIIATASLAHLDNVDVVTDDGLLVELAERIGATCLVKGIRGGVDFDYEYSLAQINRRLPPSVETLLMPADSTYDHICSALARDLLRHGRALDGVVHPAAIAAITAFRG